MSEDQGVIFESWLTVAEASARVGVSERAIQRRAKAGKLRAKLVEISTGHQWLISADSIPETTTLGNDSPDDDDNFPQNDAHSGDTSPKPSAEPLPAGPTAATQATTMAAPGPDSGDAMAAALLAEKDARIDDLRATIEAQRAQIEEANRNAAELRAALREAQRIYAKALPAPGDQEASGVATPTPDPPATTDLRPDQPQKKSWFARTFLRAD